MWPRQNVYGGLDFSMRRLDLALVGTIVVHAAARNGVWRTRNPCVQRKFVLDLAANALERRENVVVRQSRQLEQTRNPHS